MQKKAPGIFIKGIIQLPKEDIKKILPASAKAGNIKGQQAFVWGRDRP